MQGAQRLGQLNRVPGVADRLKGGASTGVTVRRTNTTGRNSTVRVSKVVQRGDIQCVELGIIQDIRQRNLFGNRLSGRSRGSSRRLADRRTVTQSLTSHRLIRVNCRLLRGCLLNLSGLSRLRRYRLGSGCRSLLNGLNRLSGLSRLRLCTRRLRYPRLPRGTRRSSGGSTSGGSMSSGTALLVEEHATAANRLETAWTLLATLLAVSCRRLGRSSSGRTSGCRANGTRSLRRRGHFLTSNSLASSSIGCILRCLHRDVRAARACRLTVQVAGRLAGSGLAGSGARLRLRSLRIRAFSSRAIYQFGCIVVGFVVGAFVRFTLSIIVLSILYFSFGAALIAVLLHLMGKRLQQTKTAHSPRTTGKNQEEDSPTPRQISKECQKAGDQGKHAQTGGNQQGDTARARSIKVRQR